MKLTDERIYEIADSDECNPDKSGWGPKFSISDFARAIEAEVLRLNGGGGEAPNISELAQYPEKCPITRRDFFMVLDHPELGRVPTYGGPFDSYTIPEMDGDPHQPMHERELFYHHYDHDRGDWVEDEFIPLRVIHDDVLNEYFDLKDKAAPQPQQAAPGAVLEGWQPIETAKNGDVVLAYGRNSAVPGEPKIWTTIRVDHLRGHWTTGTHSYPFAATVWMPLPAAPSAPKPQERKKHTDLPVEGWVVLDQETRIWAQYHGLSLLANPDGTFHVMQGKNFMTCGYPTATEALDALWQTGEFPDPSSAPNPQVE